MANLGRNYIEQSVKNFFRAIVSGGRTILTPKNGEDIAIDDGARYGLEGATGDSYMSKSAASTWIVVINGNAHLTKTNTILEIRGDFQTQADNANDIGTAARRLRNGLFGTQVGIHSGAAFTDFIAANGLGLRGVEAVTNEGVANESLRLGENTVPTVPTLMSLASEVAITNPVNGMVYYNTTLNKFRGYENGAWVNLV